MASRDRQGDWNVRRCVVLAFLPMVPLTLLLALLTDRFDWSDRAYSGGLQLIMLITILLFAALLVREDRNHPE